jgi:hypothetical protein
MIFRTSSGEDMVTPASMTLTKSEEEWRGSLCNPLRQVLITFIGIAAESDPNSAIPIK